MGPRSIAKQLRPIGLIELQAARRYAFEHGLANGPARQRRGWRAAQKVGLDSLPPGARLDGLTVDIGAHHGDVAHAVRLLEPRSRVLCVEPAPGNVAALEQRFANDSAVTVHPVAASDRAATAILHETATTQLASLHTPGPVMAGYVGGNVVADHEVATVPLDSLAVGDVRLLKIDVQGHELAVLDGATDTLKRTDTVMLEVNFVSHYEGDALFGDLNDRMRDEGFDLMALNAPSTAPSPLKWGDAFYVRR